MSSSCSVSACIKFAIVSWTKPSQGFLTMRKDDQICGRSLLGAPAVLWTQRIGVIREESVVPLPSTAYARAQRICHATLRNWPQPDSSLRIQTIDNNFSLTPQAQSFPPKTEHILRGLQASEFFVLYFYYNDILKKCQGQPPHCWIFGASLTCACLGKWVTAL